MNVGDGVTDIMADPAVMDTLMTMMQDPRIKSMMGQGTTNSKDVEKNLLEILWCC